VVTVSDFTSLPTGAAQRGKGDVRRLYNGIDLRILRLILQVHREPGLILMWAAWGEEGLRRLDPRLRLLREDKWSFAAR